MSTETDNNGMQRGSNKEITPTGGNESDQLYWQKCLRIEIGKREGRNKTDTTDCHKSTRLRSCTKSVRPIAETSEIHEPDTTNSISETSLQSYNH